MALSHTVFGLPLRCGSVGNATFEEKRRSLALTSVASLACGRERRVLSEPSPEAKSRTTRMEISGLAKMKVLEAPAVENGQLLGVTVQAEKDEIVKAVMELKNSTIEDGYTAETIVSRKVEESLEDLAPACTLELLGLPLIPDSAERRQFTICGNQKKIGTVKTLPSAGHHLSSFGLLVDHRTSGAQYAKLLAMQFGHLKMPHELKSINHCVVTGEAAALSQFAGRDTTSAIRDGGDGEFAEIEAVIEEAAELVDESEPKKPSYYRFFTRPVYLKVQYGSLHPEKTRRWFMEIL
ncbi:hypothetical protein BHM03_00051257 [Ensete ventricosum]|nr:hypothetical protein BHM03_00051257 [Ensete ventricosum]